MRVRGYLKNILYAFGFILIGSFISLGFKYFIYDKYISNKEQLKIITPMLSVDYKNMHNDLIKIDEFSSNFKSEYLKGREEFCNSNSKENNFYKINMYHSKKIDKIDYAFYIPEIYQHITTSLDYTKILTSASDFKNESYEFQKYHYKNIDSVLEMNAIAGEKILGVILDDYSGCILTKDQLNNKYDLYNEKLKDQIKTQMAMIQAFYKKYNLNLDDLNSNLL